ncbi:uncharacterized protein [Amphiura filiformis]|uniref:uncharacterized protein n=1 Tax=Amphiura filiformis TaxID=82378 RepID=UPI003B225759
MTSTGLEQMVDFPTRGDNTLDIILTNRPSLTNTCASLPGLSDHDLVFMDANVRANRRKPVQRKILLWKKADLVDIRQRVSAVSEKFTSEHNTSTPVENLASVLQQEYHPSSVAPDSEPGNRSKKLGALVKSKRCDSSGIAPLKDGGYLHTDPKTKANILNRQFTSVFSRDNGAPIPDLGESQHPSMDDIHVSLNGVIKLLKNLKPFSAPGPDGIPTMLLKETAKEIAPAVKLLFQASINQGTVPSSWKKAHIVPLFKKGSRSEAANYRPISLTSVLSYINDLPDCVTTSTTRLFADDSVLYRSISTTDDSASLQQDLDALQEWERKWLMSFNASKCQVLQITNKRKLIPANYTIHGHNLEVVNSAKYLESAWILG